MPTTRELLIAKPGDILPGVTSPQDSTAAPVVRPHPVLSRYYGSEELRRPFIKRVFDDAAVHYDRLENLMSFGTGRRYRREALKRAGLLPGMRVLDVAVGTGLVAREAMGIVGETGRVIGVDPSAGMLSCAASSLHIPLVRGRAEELPFAPNSFDFLSMGYALRHMADLTAALRQFMSVLRPGGILLILEITAPQNRLQRFLMGDYFRWLVPIASRLLSPLTRPKNPRAGKLLLDYYWDTVTECVNPQSVIESMNAAGLAQTRWSAELGVFSEYTAIKPAAGDS